MTDPLSEAESYLADAGLLGSSGAVLYSAADTLQPGPVYLLGLNPGGSSASTLQASIDASRLGNNAYLDEEWEQKRRGVIPRGTAPLQQRVQKIARMMEIEPRALPASNLAFTRSPNVSLHSNFDEAIRLCLPVHQIFLKAIRPSCLFTFGSIRNFARGFAITNLQSRSAEHAGWQAHRGEASAFGMTFRFGNVPHLSLWGDDSRNHVIEWALEGFQ